MKRVLPISSVVLALAWALPGLAADWKPAKVSIPTRWTANVSPNNALPEYPRPQMVRPDWTNLNGLWDYAITDKDAAKPEKFEGQILVPYPVESALSGVKREFTPKDRLWYHRWLTAPDLSGGKRLLLHFGAVDHDAVVWVNGKEIGTHQGGYDAFSFDITDALKPGAANDLTVAVLDATGADGEPHGKQTVNAIQHPGGIMYTPCSGIWQTVWLEPVPATSIASLKLTPDVDAGTLGVAIRPQGSPASPAGLSFEAVALDGDREVARAGGAYAYGFCTLKIPQAKLWWPDKPFLYDLKVSLLRDGRTVRLSAELLRHAEDLAGQGRQRLHADPAQRQVRLPVGAVGSGLLAGRHLHGADRRGPALRHRDRQEAGLQHGPQARQGRAGALVLLVRQAGAAGLAGHARRRRWEGL